MKLKVLLLMSLVIYGLWQFWPLLHAGFVYEDHQALPYTFVRWPWTVHVLNRNTLAVLFAPFLPGRFWTVASLWLNYQIGGMNPLGYHVLNLLIHATNVWLVYRLARLLWPHSFGLPVLAASIFGLHGIQMEAIAYVNARAELLATLFALSAISALLSDHRWLAILLAFCAGASKESAVVIWMVLAVIVAYQWAGSRWWEVLTCGALMSMGLGIWFVWSRAVWPAFAAPTDRWRYAAIQLVACVRFLGVFLWPRGVTVDHDFDSTSLLMVIGAGALIAVLFIAAWRARAHAPEALLGLLWAALAIGPRLFLRTPEYLNEHQLYLPMVGMTLACCGLLRAWLDQPVHEDLRCLFGL